MKSNKGILRFIILVIIGIVILSYFGFNLQNIFESDTSKSNFGYVWHFVSYVWNTFLVTPATFIWDKIIVGIMWESLFKPGLAIIEKMQQH